MAYTTINKSTDYFNTKLYTGNGGNQTITGVGFLPDWTWWKSRDAGNSHALVDIVRGTNKVLYSDSTSTEQPISAQTFNSDGFALVQDGGANSINSNGSTKVAWSWKAGGGQGSSNTDGTINTTYTSANTTSGFSISTVTLSGSGNQTFGHGLGVTPSLVIFKCTSHAESWKVYHSSLSSPESKYLQLNTTDDAGNASNIWGAGMTSSTVGVKVGTIGTAGQDYVAYCFAEKKGFSKFGSYTGNGNADGSFIYTGFSPAFVIIKQSSAAGESWKMYDNKRPGYNLVNNWLEPDDNQAEGTGSNQIDMVSNGFKARASNTAMNASGSTYIFMAFAEAPLVGNNNVPCTAR